MLILRRLLRLTRLGREEGQVLPMFAAGLLAMLLVSGVVIDGGNLFQHRQSLQNAADASAIAAALEVAKGNCTTTNKGPCATYAGTYAGYNGVEDDHGNIVTTLGQCPGTVNDTTPPPTPPGCYVYPYTPPGATSNDYVEVWLTQKTSNFFGGILGVGKSTESARSVGALTSGNPPPIAFAALDTTCDNHTLLIESSGNLTVNSGIYVNSCSGHDGFDVFSANKNGPFGSIKAPLIDTTGGWEVDRGTGVFVGPFPTPPECILTKGQSGGGKVQVSPPDHSAGCPHTGVAPEATADPFASFPPAPALGAGNVGPPVSITKVSRGLNGDGANVARVVTASAHGLAVGNSITISNVGYGFDGAFTVASVVNPTTFTYQNPGQTNPSPAITFRQMTGGVVTLTTNAPTTLSPSGPDTAVTVAGINAIFNVVSAAITAFTSSSFSYNSPAANRTYTVTKKGLQHGTATLTLTSTALLATGDTMTIGGVDSLLNGSFSIAVAGGNTITYPDPATQSVTVNSRSIAGSTTATINTPNTYTFAPGDSVTVNTGDSRFDGPYTAGGGSGAGKLNYTISPVKANVSSTAASAGTVTLRSSTVPFENADTVSVDSPLAYAITPLTLSAANFNAATKTFTYTSKTFQNVVVGGVSWTRSGGAITVTTASAHGLNSGDTVKVTGAPGGGACSGTFPVTGVTTTSFTYTVTISGGPGGCNPPTSGNQLYNFQVWNANSSSASGTVTLTTMPAISGSGTVTGPAFMATTNVTPNGSALLTDVPFVPSGGTFTPLPGPGVWMPTLLGVFAQNFPGSAGIPSPDEISTGTVTLQPGTYYGGICIGAASGSNCAGTNCKVAGGTTSTIQPYSTVVKLAADVPDNFDANGGSGTIQVKPAGISNGDVIAIDDEEMTVTGPPVDNGDGTYTIPVDREANGTADGPHTANTEIFQVVTTKNAAAYNPAVKLNGNITAATASVSVTWGGQPTTDPVQPNDVIQIGSEDMLVTAETPAAMSKATLTVTRGYYSTTPAVHNNGVAVLNVTSGSAANVTLAQGVYIMAGGGFSVCGSASVSAPDGVMIYNTNDPTVPTGNGALGQVNINTTGNVHLGPMASGVYAGMTIFEDRQKAFSTACPQADPTKWDVALQSAAPLPLSGELGSISGGIYAPSLHATVGDTMSGTANLVVISSCIFINGATSTFNHDTRISPLPGVTATLFG